MRGNTRIVDPWFFLVTLILTGMCFAILLDDIRSVAGWILFALSVIPVYATIYQTILFAKAGLFHRRWARDLPPAPTESGAALPSIAFVIASYQEPFEVAKMTFDCAVSAPYDGPREVVVVDNSHDVDSDDFTRWKEYVESHAGRDERVRVLFRYNDRKGGLKPGNIDLAQSLIENSQYVVLLDIDSSIRMHDDVLTRAVAEFERDDDLGVLQFHTVATNDHFNHLTGPVAVAQNALRIKHLIRADGGFAMFYGHNAMWRRTLLELNGSWLEHYRGNVMVTEDLLKSVGAYSHGYTSRYIDVPTGEWIPSSLDALESMWMRWAYGGFQVLFKYFRRIATTKGLAPMERVDLLTFLVSYGASAVFYPLSVLWFLAFPPGRVGIVTFLMINVPPLVYAWVVHRRYTSELTVSPAKKFWDLYAGFLLIETFVLVVSMRAVFNFLVGVKQGWRVTSKGLEQRPSWWQVLVRNAYVVGLAVAILCGLVAAWGLHTGFAVNLAAASYLPLAFVAVNLLLCVFIFGRQVRRAEASIEGTTIDGYNLRNEILNEVPLFHGTNALFQHRLALSLYPRTYAAGDTVMEKGEAGHEMFFLSLGDVEVTDGERRLRTMGRGSYFGERSLVLDEPRTATVRALTACECYVLEKDAMLDILSAQPRVARKVDTQIRAFTRADLTSQSTTDDS